MKHTNRAWLALAALALTLSWGCGDSDPTGAGLRAVRARGQLRAAMSGQFPPFNFYDDKNQLAGFDVDIAREVARRMDLEPALVTLQWDGILAGLTAGRYDTIIGSMAITPERQEAVDFSDPYYRSGAQVFARPGSTLARTGDIRGTTLGVNLGTTYEQTLRKREAEVAEIRTYGGIPEVLVDFEAGRLDGFVTDRLVGLHALQVRGVAAVPAGDLLYEETIAVALRQGQPGLRAAIDEALAAMKADGTYARLSTKWFGRDLLAPLDGPAAEREAAPHENSEAAARPARGLDVSVVVDKGPFLLRGMAVTAWLTATGGALALGLGLLLALARVLGAAPLAALATLYVDFLRGTPLLIQLFALYFGAPQLGLDISPMAAGILGLGLNGAAYAAESLRGGILAVPQGQWEAARALGMGEALLLRRIVLPQAGRVALPALVGNLVALLKDSSLVSTITVVELTRQAQVAIGSSFRAVELYTAAAVLYFLLTYPLMKLGDRLEARLSKGVSR